MKTYFTDCIHKREGSWGYGPELVKAKIVRLCRNPQFLHANLSTLPSATVDSLTLTVFTSIYENQNWALYISLNAQHNPFLFVHSPQRSQYSSVIYWDVSSTSLAGAWKDSLQLLSLLLKMHWPHAGNTSRSFVCMINTFLYL